MATSKKVAYLFPGQGAQYAGIGADLFEGYGVVRDTYGEASEALGYDVAKLSFAGEGSEEAERINLTRYTQPVLLTHSVACMRVFHERMGGGLPGLVMAGGHSLGEYSALVCAGGLGFAEALRLVQRRGELMGEFGEGEMAALMLDAESVGGLAGRYFCEVAAFNLEGQTVVGGRAEDLGRLVEAMEAEFPRKRAIRLKTEGAFHTYYMVEAARRFREVLEGVAFGELGVGVLSNFTGDFHGDDAEGIKSRLFLQLFNAVRWRDNLRRLMEGADVLVEFGGGLGKGEGAAEKRPNLEGMVKQVGRGMEGAPDYFSVINVGSLEGALEGLGGLS